MIALVFAGHAREQTSPDNKKPGHRALRLGRFSVASGIYLVTTSTNKRIPLFEDFWAGVIVSRCFTDAEVLDDPRILSWMG